MPYLQLTLPCTEAQQPRVERALEDVGALAVTLQDAHLDAADEQAIFEPGVGEIPLWDEMTLTALFPDDTDALVLLAALDAFDPGLDWTRARFEKVEDQDWERAWLDMFAADAVRRTLLDRALGPPAAGRRAGAGRGHRAARSGPGVRLRHPSHHRAVPALAGRARRRRRTAGQGACSTSAAAAASSRWPR